MDVRSWTWWHRPTIPTSLEAETGKSKFGTKPWQLSDLANKTLSQNNNVKKFLGMLLSVKALGSTLSTGKVRYMYLHNGMLSGKKKKTDKLWI